jgi:hypothetical protein
LSVSNTAREVVGPAVRTLIAKDVPNKHILDTSAWNALFDDPEREGIIGILRRKTILPTCVAISEIAAEPENERRLGLLRLLKRVGGDNRPLATPNQLIILACQGYARRDQNLTLNAGNDAEGAWIAINKPELVDAEAQRIALAFNREREDVFRAWNERLRGSLQPIFAAGTERPRSMGALIQHYARNDDFLYDAVNPIYERRSALFYLPLNCGLFSTRSLIGECSSSVTLAPSIRGQ